MKSRPGDGLKCKCGDDNCVVELKRDDAGDWQREVAQAELSVREWLMGLRRSSSWEA